jgi:hypothetical protein
MLFVFGSVTDIGDKMILVVKDFDIPKGNPNLVKTAYPCNLIVSRNGEVELSIQDGARYSCTAISAPHGDLIDVDYLIAHSTEVYGLDGTRAFYLDEAMACPIVVKAEKPQGDIGEKNERCFD